MSSSFNWSVTKLSQSLFRNERTWPSWRQQFWWYLRSSVTQIGNLWKTMTGRVTCSDSAECSQRDSSLRLCCPSTKPCLYRTTNHNMVTWLTMYLLKSVPLLALIVTMLTSGMHASTGTTEDLLAHHSDTRVVWRSSQVLSKWHHSVICVWKCLRSHGKNEQ